VTLKRAHDDTKERIASRIEHSVGVKPVQRASHYGDNQRKYGNQVIFEPVHAVLSVLSVVKKELTTEAQDCTPSSTILISSSVSPYKLVPQPIDLPVRSIDLPLEQLLGRRHPWPPASLAAGILRRSVLASASCLCRLSLTGL